jgi:kynurenine formamidase
MMRVIDLSLPVNNEMRGVDISVAKRLEVDGWNATTLSLYSHCGTHMDAPRHFLPEGTTLDHQDLKVCMGQAILVNLAPAEPKQLIQVDDLGSLVDSIQPGMRLLFRTDWHKRYGTPEYRNDLPRISRGLAKWLVERKVEMIGVEPPSVADVNNLEELTEVHQTLFRGNILIVEGLAHLDQISSPTVEFIALPLKITGGDGSPVRAIAIERDDDP